MPTSLINPQDPQELFIEVLRNALDEYYLGWNSIDGNPRFSHEPSTIKKWIYARVLPGPKNFYNFLENHPFDLHDKIRTRLLNLYLEAKRYKRNPHNIKHNKNYRPITAHYLGYLDFNNILIKQFISVGHKDFIVGRELDCDFVITSPTCNRVSRRHFRIFFKWNSYYLEDLDSRNGTFLNGKRIESRMILSINAEIKVGDDKFIFTNYDGVTKYFNEVRNFDHEKSTISL